MRPSSRPSESPEKRRSQLVLVDGHIYSDGEDGFNDNEDVIFETPMKKKPKPSTGPLSANKLVFDPVPNLNVPNLTAPYDEEEEVISSSPIMKTPRHNETRSIVIPRSNAPTPSIRTLKPDIYDENSPNFMFPGRDRSNAQSPLLFPWFSRLRFESLWDNTNNGIFSKFTALYAVFVFINMSFS